MKNLSCWKHGIIFAKISLPHWVGSEWKCILRGCLLTECSRLMIKALGVVWSVRGRECGVYVLLASCSLHSFFLCFIYKLHIIICVKHSAVSAKLTRASKTMKILDFISPAWHCKWITIMNTKINISYIYLQWSWFIYLLIYFAMISILNSHKPKLVVLCGKVTVVLNVTDYNLCKFWTDGE